MAYYQASSFCFFHDANNIIIVLKVLEKNIRTKLIYVLRHKNGKYLKRSKWIFLQNFQFKVVLERVRSTTTLFQVKAYNWNFEENMTDLQLPRYQPKKKKKCCGYIGSTMLFVIKSIAVFLLMTILIRARFRKLILDLRSVDVLFLNHSQSL
ncbi:unnamed protein product [Oikopleura dioica]|uniref:Uncharacterized protein n=1 Tax=Oikopleura dioica TaxID=34765 RepID=E4XE74_OIKDI|nr:unnamed protein product [Oikopleura dioica]